MISLMYFLAYLLFFDNNLHTYQKNKKFFLPYQNLDL